MAVDVEGNEQASHGFPSSTHEIGVKIYSIPMLFVY